MDNILFKELEMDYSRDSINRPVPAVRLLPMAKKNPEFDGMSVEEIALWFEEELPYKSYRYKRGMDTPPGTAVLFQYDGYIVASAVLQEKEEYEKTTEYGYRGHYWFKPSSIRTFRPVSLEELQSVWSEVKTLSQSQQRLSVEKYPSFQKLVAYRRHQNWLEKNDEEFQKAVEKAEVSAALQEDRPVELMAQTITSSVERWGRDPLVSKRVLIRANDTCEYDETHYHFKSSRTGKNYVEAHHLIPLGFQGDFDKSLDVEANVISLCALCHKMVHHATKVEKSPILRELYEKRKGRLEKCGLYISFEELEELY